MTRPKPETIMCNNTSLFKQYADYINSPQFSDVSFRVFESEEHDDASEERQVKVKDCDIIHSHKVVLAAASPWFKTLFTNGMHESSQKTMNVCDVKLDIFRSLINYCYT
ncbi:MAG: BTB/POZ protein [Benjaminiella poitrasii]|nr:MAG: BTB/POZ protein [Benjaminiella poitrasii]